MKLKRAHLIRDLHLRNKTKKRKIEILCANLFSIKTFKFYLEPENLTKFFSIIPIRGKKTKKARK